TEACEYTNSFHSFFPTTEVVLNVKADHLDFFKDLDDIRNSFRTYTHLLPEHGSLVINGEIDDLDFFTEGLPCKVLTFGLHGDFDLTARNISYNTAYPSYDLYCAGEYICPVTLHIPGEHNVYNSLAALAVCQSLGMDLIKAAECMEHFHGVDRRFQFKGSLGGVTVIDDYAHHPDEIQATLSAATDLPHRKLWVVFQPHTYTRTQAFLPEFAQALSEADHVVLAEIYAAREKNELGISSADLQKLIQEKGVPCEYFPTFDEIENFLLENCTDGDVLITMGAGDVVNIGNSLLGL
ncbi:MAG: UDP-N-acetylmuramate--L-alanine ligase, partial [Parasporobacterium sp.]|nr:UDP-N-acetylmuramate--L-alanine ligase [Parasporobacterium sp.]